MDELTLSETPAVYRNTMITTAAARWIVFITVLTTEMLMLNGQESQGGPICFACDETSNPEDCRTPLSCYSDQACSVQELIKPHGEVTFWSGCEDVQVCADLSSRQQSPVTIGRRELSYANQRCVYCCSTDLCNRNCTSFVNLALNRPAYQSSVAWNGTANLAVDGDITSSFFHGSCTHNNATETYPWWAVDLGNKYTVTKVKIYERGHATFDDRMFHLSILVSDYNATQITQFSPLFTTCGTYVGHSGDGDVITINCPKMTSGRWIRIQDTDPRQEYLHLCEVEVFGY